MTTSTTERSVVDVLRAARERISDPERWATGEYAYRSSHDDDYVAPDSASACRWCAAGSILAEYDLADLRGVGIEHAPAMAYLARALDGPDDDPQAAIACIANFNDAPGHGHADVLHLFDRAIEVAEAEA